MLLRSEAGHSGILTGSFANVSGDASDGWARDQLSVWADSHGVTGITVQGDSEADPTHDDGTVMNGAPSFVGGPPAGE